jgi:hypothetical protein
MLNRNAEVVVAKGDGYAFWTSGTVCERDKIDGSQYLLLQDLGLLISHFRGKTPEDPKLEI